MRNSKKVYNTKAQYKKYYVFTNYIDLNILFVFIFIFFLELYLYLS